MPSLTPEFLAELKAELSDFPTFVETGTYEGGTIFAMEPCFDKLYTIEFSEKYHEAAKAKYSGDKISFLLGDSGVLMSSLVSELTTNAIFFLDGHWSSGDTGRGAKDVPLAEELAAIAAFPNTAIVIIDDFRLFGKGPDSDVAEDWTQITKDAMIAIVGDRLIESYHLASEYATDDRLVLHLRGIGGGV
jgi:hypothetical protein